MASAPVHPPSARNAPAIRHVALDGFFLTLRSDSFDLTPADSGGIARLFAEVSALKNLSHVWCGGLCSDAAISYDLQQQPCLTLKLPHSSSKWTLISSVREPLQVRAFGSVVARILHHWHALGVVHRSVAPSSVLVDLAQAHAPDENSVALLSWGGCAFYNWSKASYICADPYPHPSASHAPPERLSFSLEMFAPLTPAEDWFSLGRIIAMASSFARTNHSEFETASDHAFPMLDPALSVLVSDTSVIGSASVVLPLLELDPVVRHLNGFVISKELMDSTLSEHVYDDAPSGLYCPTGLAWPIPGLEIHHDGHFPLSEVLCFKTHINMSSIHNFDSASFVSLGCAIAQSLFVSWNDVSGDGKRRGAHVGWHLESPSFFIVPERSVEMTLLQSVMAALDSCEVKSDAARTNLSRNSLNVQIDRDNVVAKLGDLYRQEPQGITILMPICASELVDLIEINSMVLKNGICAVFVALVDAGMPSSILEQRPSRTTQIIDLTTPLADCQYLRDSVLHTLNLPQPLLSKVVATFDDKLGTSSGAVVSEFLLWSHELVKHDVIRYVPESGMVHCSLLDLPSVPVSHRAASRIVQRVTLPGLTNASDLLRLCSAVSATCGDTCSYELPVELALIVADVSRSTIDEAVVMGLCAISRSKVFGFEIISLAHESFRSLPFDDSKFDMHIQFVQKLYSQIISVMQSSPKDPILTTPFRPGLINFAVSLVSVFCTVSDDAKFRLKHKIFALCEHMFALSSVGSTGNDKSASFEADSLSISMRLPSHLELTRLILLGVQLSNGSLEHHKARSFASAGVSLLSSLDKSLTTDATTSMLHFQMRCDMLISFINQNIAQGFESEMLLLKQYSAGGSSRWSSGAIFSALLDLSQSVNCMQRCHYYDAFNFGMSVFATLQHSHEKSIVINSDPALNAEQLTSTFSKCMSHVFWSEELDSSHLSLFQTNAVFLHDAFERLILPSLCCGMECVMKLVTIHSNMCLSDERSMLPISLSIVPVMKMIIASHSISSSITLPSSVLLEFVAERIMKTPPGLQFLQACLWTAFSIIPFSSPDSIKAFLEAYSSRLRPFERLSEMTAKRFVYPYNGSSLLGASHVLFCVASDLNDANEGDLCCTAQFFSAALSFISGCDISHLHDALSYTCSSRSLSNFGDRLLGSLMSVIQSPSQGPASCRKDAEILPDMFYFVILSIESLWNLILSDWNAILSAFKRAAVLKMGEMVPLFQMNLKFCSCFARLQKLLAAQEEEKKSLLIEVIDDFVEFIKTFLPESVILRFSSAVKDPAEAKRLMSSFVEESPSYFQISGSGMLQILCALFCEVLGFSSNDLCDCYESAYNLCVRDGLYLHSAIACQFGHKSCSRTFLTPQVAASSYVHRSEDGTEIASLKLQKGDQSRLMIDLRVLRQLERAHALYSVMRFDTPVLIAQQVHSSLSAAIFPDCPLSKSATHIGQLWFSSFVLHDRLLRMQGCFGAQSQSAIFGINSTSTCSPSGFSRLVEHANRLKSDVDKIEAPAPTVSPVGALLRAAQIIGRSIGAQQAIVLSKITTSVSLSATIEALAEVSFLPLHGENGDNVVAMLNQTPVENLPDWLLKFGFNNRGVHVFQNISTSFGSNLLPEQEDGSKKASPKSSLSFVAGNSARSISSSLRIGAASKRGSTIMQSKHMPSATATDARHSSVVMLSWGNSSSGKSEPHVSYLLWFEHRRILGMFGPDFYLNTQVCSPETFHPRAHPLAFVLGRCLPCLKYLSGSEQLKVARKESVSFLEVAIDDAAQGNQIADRTPVVGMLWKRGSVVKNWKERHFQLFNTTLKYFNKDDRIKALNTIEITHETTLLEVSVQDRKEISAPYDFCWLLIYGTKQIYLCSDQSTRMKKWMKILSSTIEHARQVMHRRVETYAFNACVAPPPLHSMTIVKRLGAGGFGEVFLASWNGLLVAVKKMTKELTATTLFRFRREADMMSIMRHPNILTYMACCLEPPNLMIVMEYMRYGSLFNVLQVS